MGKTLLTAASIESALNNPVATLNDFAATHRLTGQMETLLSGVGGIEGLNRLPALDVLFGAEGEDPAGYFSRHDQVVTVPGNRGMTVDGQNVNEIWQNMQAMLRAFNGAAEAVVSWLTFRTTRSNEKVGVPHTPGFQKATEYGRPSKVRVKLVSRGFPLDHFDLADGYTQEFIDDATAAQLMAVQTTIMNSWSTLRREITLDALMGNANYTDKDGILVKRLYNGDGEVPPTIKRWTHDDTHTHYLFSGSGTFTQANLDTMSTHLIHHGFKEFGATTFVLHANRTDMPTIRGFTNFIPAESGSRPQELANSGVVAGVRGSAPQGFVAEGYVNDWVVVENNDLPSGYLLGQVISGGPFNGRNPVGMREHSNASARGLRLIEGGKQDYPLYDSVYDGYAGAGVGQRGAAVVMFAHASAYTAPTFSTGE